jgi:hypothetical protein
MMSILEYLEWRGVIVDDYEERMWWIGWEDAHCMGRSYDGWRELSSSSDGRYEKFAALVVDYLLYCKSVVENVSNHYVYNEPGVSYEEVICGNQRGGGCNE